MAEVFKFKQFEVDQKGCAMKINTDGVLLAAMADGDAPQRILDIGTGTGVIALMLAQRFAPAFIEAVEIDAEAAQTAGKNFKNSPFTDRLAVHHVSIEQFESLQHFDLIVSNPPYFVNDLKNAEEKKGIARHTNELFFRELIAKVAALLTPEGCFWFVLPVKQAEFLIDQANVYGLSAARQIFLHSDQQKSAFRQIVCLKRNVKQVEQQHFYIYESEKRYTADYKAVLKDFFLGY